MDTIKTLTISAKCSDMFSAIALNSDGKCVGDYDGYVPEMMGKDTDGDYLCFNIDVKTGRILNWTPPSQATLRRTFGLTKA